MSWDILKSQPFWALIGVIVGSLLTTAKDVFLDLRNQKRLATYAAIRIVCVLDNFVEGCLNVAIDEGENRLQPHGQNEREFAVEVPILEAFSDDIDWKALDPAVSYNILSFPVKIDEANRAISFVFDMISGPPDYDEGFEERQFRYTELGLAAIAIANELRRKHGISARTYDCDEWSPAKRLPDIKAKIERSRAAARQRDVIASADGTGTEPS